MASATSMSTRTPPSPTFWENAARPWPERHWRRWGLRLLAALPFALMAVWTARVGFVDPTSRQLGVHAQELVKYGWNLEGLPYGFPPITIALVLLPGPQVLYGIGSALAFGVLVQVTLWIILRNGVGPSLTVVLISMWLAVPAIWYEASQRLDTVAAVALLALAVNGWTRFCRADHTDGGITAGIALAVALNFNPIALSFALMLGLTVPLYLHLRGRPQRMALPLLTVLLFPSIVVVLWWGYMSWQFTGQFGGTWELLVSSYGNLDANGLGGAMDLVANALLYCPIYIAVGVTIALRSRVFLAIYVAPLIGLAISSMVHLPFVSLALVYFLLVLIAITSVGGDLSDLEAALVTVVAFAQLVLMLLWPFESGYYPEWLAALGWFDSGLMRLTP